MMAKLDDNSPMPYGRFKGAKMANIPAWYLLKLRDTDKMSAEVKEYIDEMSDVLNKEAGKRR